MTVKIPSEAEMSKKLRVHRPSDLLVRADRHDDADMIKECASAYRHFNFHPDDVVVDFGVNVGGFMRMAAKAGVARYVGIEADPENFAIARMNSKRLNCRTPIELIWGAASASDAEWIEFAQTTSGNAKCSGTVAVNPLAESKRTVRYSVPNHDIRALLSAFKPTLVKMDIEGAEYGWLEQCSGVFPKHIREIAFDLHWKTGIARFESEWLDRILKDYELVSVEPNTAYEGNKSLSWSYPKLGVSGHGRIFAADVFFRRR